MKPIADVGDMAVFTFWGCSVIGQISLPIRVAEIAIFFGKMLPQSLKEYSKRCVLWYVVYNKGLKGRVVFGLQGVPSEAFTLK